MAELADILSRAETLEPYDPTLRDKLRHGITQFFGGGYRARDFADRVAGTNLPKTPLGGLADLIPGVSTAMDVQEGSRAWDQGRGLDAAMHFAGPALDAAGLGYVANTPAGRRAISTVVDRANQPGPVPTMGSNFGSLFDEGDLPEFPVPPKPNTGSTLVDDILMEMDRGGADYISPQAYEAARAWDPQALQAGLDERIPMSLMTDEAPLGMNERVYHYTTAGPRVPYGVSRVDPTKEAFPYFEPDRGSSGLTFDRLGPHVGTPQAAYDRGRSQGVQFSKIPTPWVHDEEQLARFPQLRNYERDTHPDAAWDVMLPSEGQMMELAADLSKPFTPADAMALQDELNFRLRTEFDPEQPNWSEDNINFMLNKWFDNNLDNPGLPKWQSFGQAEDHMREVIRPELARRGFTHVPYINEVEDPGSISHVMLTDRPPGSKAVVRDRRANFHPLLKSLPNLMAGATGAAVLGNEALNPGPQ